MLSSASATGSACRFAAFSSPRPSMLVRWSSGSRVGLIVIVLAGCVGCDQTTKSLAQSYLPVGDIWSFLGDTVRVQLTHNYGVFLGFGSALPEFWRLALFEAAVGALLLALLAYAALTRGAAASSVVAMALLVAGGLSNLTDRLVHGGYVVDFI